MTLAANKLTCLSVMATAEAGDAQVKGTAGRMSLKFPIIPLSSKFHGGQWRSPGPSVSVSQLRNFELRKPNLLKSLQTKLFKRRYPLFNAVPHVTIKRQSGTNCACLCSRGVQKREIHMENCLKCWNLKYTIPLCLQRGIESTYYQKRCVLFRENWDQQGHPP